MVGGGDQGHGVDGGVEPVGGVKAKGVGVCGGEEAVAQGARVVGGEELGGEEEADRATGSGERQGAFDEGNGEVGLSAEGGAGTGIGDPAGGGAKRVAQGCGLIGQAHPGRVTYDQVEAALAEGIGEVDVWVEGEGVGGLDAFEGGRGVIDGALETSGGLLVVEGGCGEKRGLRGVEVFVEVASGAFEGGGGEVCCEVALGLTEDGVVVCLVGGGESEGDGVGSVLGEQVGWELDASCGGP